MNETKRFVVQMKARHAGARWSTDMYLATEEMANIRAEFMTRTKGADYDVRVKERNPVTKAKIDGLRAKIASWERSVAQWSSWCNGPGANETDEYMLARAERRLAETRAELAHLQTVRHIVEPVGMFANGDVVRIVDDADFRWGARAVIVDDCGASHPGDAVLVAWGDKYGERCYFIARQLERVSAEGVRS
jgi:hypothetical protein